MRSGIDDGADVAQLEQNLTDLGFGADVIVDNDFDKHTTAAIKAWQESLQRSELQAAVDSARHANNQSDSMLRRDLLIASKQQFNTLSHHYKQQWARSESEADVRAINELYTLAIIGYALVSSDLGLRDAAADLKVNCLDWTDQARLHAKRICCQFFGVGA